MFVGVSTRVHATVFLQRAKGRADFLFLTFSGRAGGQHVVLS